MKFFPPILFSLVSPVFERVNPKKGWEAGEVLIGGIQRAPMTDPNGAKISAQSPKGAKYYSPGQRPGNQLVRAVSPEGATQSTPPKTPIILAPFHADTTDPNGANLSPQCPKGAEYYSPGQRPGYQLVKAASPEWATQPVPSKIPTILEPFTTDPISIS